MRYLDVLIAQVQSAGGSPFDWIRDGGFLAVIGLLLVGMGFLIRELADRGRRIELLQAAQVAQLEKRVTDAQATSKMLADALNETAEHDAILKRTVDEVTISNEIARRGGAR